MVVKCRQSSLGDGLNGIISQQHSTQLDPTPKDFGDDWSNRENIPTDNSLQDN